MTLDPHLVALVGGTVGAGWLMAAVGLEKRALEWRRRRRICPSCGMQVRGRVCTRCGAR